MNTSECLRNALKDFKFLKDEGVVPIIARYGEVDIAYPANEKEYCVLGGYAVLKVVAIAENQKELPIEKVYFQFRDEKVMPLTNLGVRVGGSDFLANKVKEVKDDKERVYFENTSFWAIPTIFFIDDDGLIAIDFRGERKAFKILRGPWKTDSRVKEWMEKHLTGQLQASDHIEYDLIANFIEREFFKSCVSVEKV